LSLSNFYYLKFGKHFLIYFKDYKTNIKELIKPFSHLKIKRVNKLFERKVFILPLFQIITEISNTFYSKVGAFTIKTNL
jgi:hypothetical protein